MEFSLTDRVEPSPREVREFFGDLLTPSGAPVRTLTLEGLDLTDRFILVTTDFQDEEGDFGNAPSAMIEAYGPGPDPLPIVVATRSAMWIRPRDFRTGGLEFDSGMGPFPVRLDTNHASTEGTMFGIVTKSKWNWGGCIAFARGRNDTLGLHALQRLPRSAEALDGLGGPAPGSGRGRRGRPRLRPRVPDGRTPGVWLQRAAAGRVPGEIRDRNREH